MEQLTWFGRGPWDSYRDRKEACLPAVYQSTVTDQQEDYIMPQEHGTKQEVRWMSLTNSEGQGLLFVAPDQMAASAVHFRPEDNYTDRDNRSKHTYQFKTCTNTIVSLDAATRGLGNASCGSDVMEKYELRAADTSFRFFIMPVETQPSSLTSYLSKSARVDMPVCQSVYCERLTNGRIKLSTPTKGATIWYSINGGEYKKYTTSLLNNDACTITAYSAHEGLFSSPVMTYELPLFVNKSVWKLVSADSQHGGNEAQLAFDNNIATFWHTEYWGSEPTCPHTLIVDMVNTYHVTVFTYLARQDGNQNGMVKAYEVYLSTDGKTWGQPVATGEFKNTTQLQTAELQEPTTARYLKFVAKSEINGNAWTSAAEIGIEAISDIDTGVNPLISSHATSNTCHSSSVFDLQGRKVMPTAQTLDSSTRLRKGIYICDGKKIIK